MRRFTYTLREERQPTVNLHAVYPESLSENFLGPLGVLILSSSVSSVVGHRTKLLHKLRLCLLLKSIICTCVCIYVVCMHACVHVCLIRHWLPRHVSTSPEPVLPSFPGSCRAFMATVAAVGPMKLPPYFTPTSNPVL
jgi:hypothetical protein